jgi:selenocysteine lyase/cysteine desulfurase
VQSEFNFENPEFRLKTTALRFEEGSMNLMGIFGLGAAIGLLHEIGLSEIHARVLDLGDRIIREVENRGHAVLTPKSREERGGNITITGPFDPAKVRDTLREKGIMVNVRGGGLRVSPHFYNTEGEIEKLFSILGAS